MKLKTILKGTKGVGLFAGGAIFASLARQVLGSQGAREIYVNALAKGMHAVDGVNTVVSNVKQEAEDLYEEATDVYAHEKQLEAIEQLDEDDEWSE